MKFRGKHLWPVLTLVLLIIPAVRDNFTVGFFPMHDDMQVIRQVVMDKCFRDKQIPCRWSEDLGYGYGYPLFNYYPSLPYYFGEIFRFLGVSLIDTVKVLVVLSFLASALTMYLLGQEFWGRWGGIVSALFYVYAPYHAVDVYVRGAMAENWALVWFPLIYWSLYKLIVSRRWFYVPTVAISTAFLMLSHNPMLLIFAPTALAWSLFWLWRSRNLKVFPQLFLGGVWALALAAFFTLPVLLEQKYVHIETMTEGYFNYLAHFANLNQLFFSRFWGYGPSVYGTNDGMPFPVGHFHWIAALLSLGAALLLLRKKLNLSLMIVLIFGMTGLVTFMAHEKSSPIWSAITTLQFLQFPWRFLSLSIFGTSFLAGSLVLAGDLIPWKKIKPVLLAVLVLTTVLFYKDFFYWDKHWLEVTDQSKLSGELWRLQTTAGIFDYLPKDAPMPPANHPQGDAQIIDGEGSVRKISKNSVLQQYRVETAKDSVFQINTFYFPGWRYFVNGREVSINPKDDKDLGRPRLKLDAGESLVTAKLTDTPIRTAANILSLLSWGAFVFLGGKYLSRRCR